jgi:hypothetical protein
MRAPEFIGRRRLFDQLRGAPGKLTTRDRAVTEYVSNTISELLAYFANSCIGAPAVRTVVASIFHQRDFGARRSQCVVAFRIDGAFQAIVHGSN